MAREPRYPANDRVQRWMNTFICSAATPAEARKYLGLVLITAARIGAAAGMSQEELVRFLTVGVMLGEREVEKIVV